MTFKQTATSAYFLIAFLFGIYGWLFGPSNNKGLFYHLGAGLVWPVTVFPALGTGIEAILIVVFIILVLAFGKSSSN